jgi:chemotaxis protein MotC
VSQLDPAILSQPHNVRALIVLTLSGGESAILRKLLASGSLLPEQESLVQGTLAYAEGKYAQATRHLQGINARSLDVSLAGRVALVQATLLYKSDLKGAIARLDLARLLATGTLVEEAALRRQAVLVAAAHDLDRFEQVSGQYFRRFRQSVYASDFKQQFSIGAAGLDYSSAPGRLMKLKAIVESLNEPERASLFVLLAERAAFVGNVALTDFAAANAIAVSKDDSIERVRSELYQASARAASTQADQAAAQLQKIPAAVLEDADTGLLHAALSVTEQVLRPPQPSHEPTANATPQGTSADADTALPANATAAGSKARLTDGVLAAVQRAVQQADALLNGTRP